MTTFATELQNNIQQLLKTRAMKRIFIEFTSEDYAERFILDFQKDEEWKSIQNYMDYDGRTVCILVKDGFEEDALPAVWSDIYTLGFDYVTLSVTER